MTRLDSLALSEMGAGNRGQRVFIGSWMGRTVGNRLTPARASLLTLY